MTLQEGEVMAVAMKTENNCLVGSTVEKDQGVIILHRMNMN